MNLDDLISKGGLVDTALVKKKGVWKRLGTNSEGQEIELEDEVGFFVKRASHAMFKTSIEGAFESGEKLEQNSALIASHIRLGEDGKEVLTYEQAYSLESSLARVFMDAINEIYSKKK